VSIKAAAGQFIRRKTKGYLSEIYRVAALCESHKQRFRALEKKKFLFEKQLRFSLQKSLKRGGNHYVRVFPRTRLFNGRSKFRLGYRNLVTMKTYYFGVLGPTRWRTVFNYLSLGRFLKKN